MDYLKLEMESHPHLCTIGWIKGLSIKITDLYHVPISIDKFYHDSVACDVIDMDTCHILLRRSWQHNIDATHRGKENIYMFIWKGKRVAMRLILPTPKSTKEKEPKFISICNRGKLLVESKETKQIFALMVKKEVNSTC